MDFIMDHSSLFLSVGVIMLLALIGYYADKSESKKNKAKSSKPSTGKDEVNNESISTSNDVKNDIMDSFSQLPHDVPDANVNGVWDNNVSFEEPVKSISEPVEDLTSEISTGIDENDYFDISQDIPVIDTEVSEQVSSSIPEEPVIPVLDSSIPEEPVIPTFDANQNLSVNDIVSSQSNVDEGILKNVPVENVISNVFDSTSFENTGMSLDDLEKKNYEKIVNNMKNNSLDDYSNDFDDSGVDEFINSSNSNVSNSITEFDDNALNQSNAQIMDVSENLEPNNDQTVISNESFDEPIDSVSADNVSQPINPFAFGVDEQSVVEPNDNGNVQSVPELNDESVVSSDFNSSNDDIWKF